MNNNKKKEEEKKKNLHITRNASDQFQLQKYMHFHSKPVEYTSSIMTHSFFCTGHNEHYSTTTKKCVMEFIGKKYAQTLKTSATLKKLTAEKAQQEPHWPWSLIGVTAPLVLQSTFLGSCTSSSGSMKVAPVYSRLLL